MISKFDVLILNWNISVTDMGNGDFKLQNLNRSINVW